ncbi:hypothetical protein COO55_32895 [Rhodococcus opacus]|nr:hypothetical protein COO55_32895 [Rhodococcus opacus]
MSTWSTRSAASMNDVEIVPRAGRTLSSDRGDVPPQRERAHDKSCVTPYRLVCRYGGAGAGSRCGGWKGYRCVFAGECVQPG